MSRSSRQIIVTPLFDNATSGVTNCHRDKLCWRKHARVGGERSRRRMPGLQSKEEIFSERLKEVSFAGSRAAA